MKRFDTRQDQLPILGVIQQFKLVIARQEIISLLSERQKRLTCFLYRPQLQPQIRVKANLYAGFLLGGWMRRLTALLVFAYFFFSFGPVMNTFVFHLRDYFLPDYPVALFVILPLLVGMYGCYHGLEVIGRMALIGVFSLITLNILLMLGSFREFDINNLRPIMESGLVKVAWASRHNNTDWSLAVMMAAVLLPMVKNPAKWKRAGSIGIAIAGLMVVMWPMLESGVLSAPVTAEFIVSCMQMARSAHIGHFVHRYEMIMIIFFSVSAMLQIMVCLLCASVAASKAAGLKDHRSMIIPAALLLGGFGYWTSADHLRAMQFMGYAWPLIAHALAVGLPLMLGVLGLLMKRKLQGGRSSA